MLLETSICHFEPWFSCLKTTLPGFQPIEDSSEEDLFRQSSDGSYVKTPSKQELRKEQMQESLLNTCINWMTSLRGNDAKEMLRKREKERAQAKTAFLPESRTAMITDDETDKILLSAWQYMFALNEQIQTFLDFQINCYLYNAFKDKIGTFSQEFTSDSSWESMIPNDASLEPTIKELKDKISCLQESLSDVQAMQMQF